MKSLPNNIKIWIRLLSVAMMVCLTFTGVLSQVSYAGTTSVLLNPQVYFTIEQDSLAAGTDLQTLNFTLRLTNNSNSKVSFNGYGVKIIDAKGETFSSHLSVQNSSVVNPNKTQDYKFTSQIPTGLTLADLKADIFAWDLKAANFMREIGAIALASVDSTNQNGTQPLLLSLQAFDTTLPNDAALSIDASRASSILKGSEKYISVDLSATNQSVSSMKFPSALQFALIDSSGLQYTGAAVAGGDQSFLPKETKTVTLEFQVGSSFTDESFVVQLYNKGISADDLIGSLNTQLTGSTGTDIPALAQTTVGNFAVTLKNTQRLTFENNDVLLSEIEIKNMNTKTVAIPSLYGEFRTDESDNPASVISLLPNISLTPNQKTMVFVYSKLDINSIWSSGKLFIGENVTGSVSDPKATPTLTKHELQKFDIPALSAIPQAPALGTEWSIADIGSQSSGKVIESNMYTLGNQKLLAVHLQETNMEIRNGSVVPYSGYFVGSDGSVWSATTTQPTGRLCATCTAMETLWVALPEGISDTSSYKLVLGTKLDDTVFAHAQTMDLAPVGDVNAYTNWSQTITAALNPFNFSFQSIQLITSVPSSANKYTLQFNYLMSKSSTTIGADKDRQIELVLKDGLNNTMKVWDYPITGAGSLQNGVNKLSADLSALDNTYMYSRHLELYEKFENGTRLIGSTNF